MGGVARKAGFRELTPLKEFYSTSVRFFLPPNVIPNVEVKRATTSNHYYAVNNRKRLSICGKVEFYIGPLEHQIAYKLYLGSPKDIEDAYFIWNACRDRIKWKEVKEWAKRLKVEERLRYLEE